MASGASLGEAGRVDPKVQPLVDGALPLPGGGRGRGVVADRPLAPVPTWLLWRLDAAPADLFVVGAGKPVLYAPRGAPTAPLRDRLARGLVLWAEPLPPDRLVSALLDVLARIVDARLGSPAGRGAGARSVLAAVYAVAGDGSSVEREATNLRTPDDILGRRAAAAGLLAAAGILEPLLADDTVARAVLEAQPGGPTSQAAVVERSIDGALYARLLAGRLGVLGAEPSSKRLLLGAMLVRDLPVLGSAQRRPPHDRHPLEAAELLATIVGQGSIGVRLVARHHERPDGSGHPFGLSRSSLSDLDLVVAAADAVTGVLPPGSPARLDPAEAASLVRVVIGRRFPAEIADALAEIVAEFGPSGRPQRPA